MTETIKGQIKWFHNQKGYGFIKHEGQPDVFVHYQYIVGEGYRALSEDQWVEYRLNHGAKGPYATEIKPAD